MKGKYMAEIGAALGITKNLGNYESARIDASAKLEVEDISDAEAWKKIWTEIESQVESQLLEIADGLE